MFSEKIGHFNVQRLCQCSLVKVHHAVREQRPESQPRRHNPKLALRAKQATGVGETFILRDLDLLLYSKHGCIGQIVVVRRLPFWSDHRLGDRYPKVYCQKWNCGCLKDIFMPIVQHKWLSLSSSRGYFGQNMPFFSRRQFQLLTFAMKKRSYCRLYMTYSITLSPHLVKPSSLAFLHCKASPATPPKWKRNVHREQESEQKYCS